MADIYEALDPATLRATFDLEDLASFLKLESPIWSSICSTEPLFIDDGRRTLFSLLLSYLLAALYPEGKEALETRSTSRAGALGKRGGFWDFC